jgi:SAM-dependent methyltransferase
VEAYDASTYGERIADVYDEWAAGLDRAGAPELLLELAADGPALDLGIGTGTLALELVERGLQVHGVEASPSMLERLRAKPRGAELEVTLGDFAKELPPGPFSLVYAVGDSFMQLASQEEQIQCFRLVAERLRPNGAFLIEAATGWTRTELSRVIVQRIETDSVLLWVSREDPVRQSVEAAHVLLADSGTSVYPLRIRYARPAELDLMARLAGLELSERWADWRRSPLRGDSNRQVSVYRAGASR